MSQPAELFTVGVEVEYQITDPTTRGLCPKGRYILSQAQHDCLGAAVQLEFASRRLR